VQRIVKLDETTIALNVHGQGKTTWLLICVHPEFARVHFMESKPDSPETAGDFVRLLRSHMEGARIKSCQMDGLDRILRIHMERTEEAPTMLVAELMGKHSNLILVSAENQILACAKPIGVTKSSRIVLVGRKFVPPPLSKRDSMLNAKSWEDLRKSEGASPFLVRLLESTSDGNWSTAIASLKVMLREIGNGDNKPVFSSEFGAYPIDISKLSYPTVSVPNLSYGLDRFYREATARTNLILERHSLQVGLQRVILSREAAIHDLNEVLSSELHAGKWQMYGELLLAYSTTISTGASVFRVQDYSFNDIEILLDDQLDPIENASRYFAMAKKSKANKETRKEQLKLLSDELVQLKELESKIIKATSILEIKELANRARQRKWLQVPRAHADPGAKPSDDPFQGHRIRKLEAPGGLRVLYGENATSNDFLTLRIAKPNDIWLHVRGGNSAHVVIQTGNAPERVGKEIIEFAATVAVRNSPSKHAGYVPVDYTLKKYVRKPKGAPVGTALYTHEKTVHVES
jgi:predicted ribosome quality control (RQC) complex YloA/Tae2 family protein